jgi:hypothetical protein
MARRQPRGRNASAAEAPRRVPSGACESGAGRGTVPRVLRFAVAGLAVTVGLMGCGGLGGDATNEKTPREPTLSHAALVGRMNAACAEFNEQEVPALNRQLSQARTPAAKAAALRAGAEAYTRALPRLTSLHPSPQDAPAFDRYLTALRRQRAALERGAEATASSNQADLTALGNVIKRESAKRLDAAIDLGADKCGRQA